MLVAFTIELDNEFERRMPHRTTDFGGPPGAPWAVLLQMWSNFMRVVDDDGVTVAELTRRARATPHLAGMRRWGYVTVAPDQADARSKPPERDLVVRPTTAGRTAQAVWCPLPSELEQRWRARFGARAIDEPRRRLETIADASDDGRSRLFEGLAPAPDNWRSRTCPPQCAPGSPDASPGRSPGRRLRFIHVPPPKG